MSYLFTSESVSEGHPDKVSDQISDALLDHYLAFDEKSRVAVETLVTTGQVVVAGEVTSTSVFDVQKVIRNTINKIGYNKSDYMFDGNSCGILNAIHSQSPDINRGVDRKDNKDQGAGDQGMMFGYANNETEEFMPLPLFLAHLFMSTLAEIRKEGKVMTYLRPDAKSQVTIEYDDDNNAKRIDTIVISTQHDEFDNDFNMRAKIIDDVKNILIPAVRSKVKNANVQYMLDGEFNLLVNPTGKFVIGGPHGDTGLTGRKIIVDTYGGRGAHGGGAFSGKDSSKVDRSAAYAARYIAKNMVAAGVADEMLVQISYAIGVAEPVSVNVNTFGTANVELTDGEFGVLVNSLFDLRPKAIEERLKLRQPMYEETASYGHMGRKAQYVTKKFTNISNDSIMLPVELFTWEKLDMVDVIRHTVNIQK